jgi:hypothetical protein
MAGFVLVACNVELPPDPDSFDQPQQDASVFAVVKYQHEPPASE